MPVEIVAVAMRSWRWLWGSQEALSHDDKFWIEWKDESMWLWDELSMELWEVLGKVLRGVVGGERTLRLR